MLEDAVRLEMRIYVLEYFISSLWAMTCLQTSTPMEFWERTRTEMMEGVRKKTFPQVDAARSDLLSSELESAATHLASLVSDQINVVLKHWSGLARS